MIGKDPAPNKYDNDIKIGACNNLSLLIWIMLKCLYSVSSFIRLISLLQASLYSCSRWRLYTFLYFKRICSYHCSTSFAFIFIIFYLLGGWILLAAKTVNITYYPFVCFNRFLIRLGRFIVFTTYINV